MKTTFKPGAKIRLKRIDPAADSGLKKDKAARICERNKPRINDLAYRMSVEGKHAILIVLQGMDTAGKDGVVRHVIDAINPQSCQVHSFKVPTEEERRHDFLWRHAFRVPALGMIGIHVRSHYEPVLVERVRNLVPKSTWSQRYELINSFERTLARSGVVLLKFFLHISRDEQLKRLTARRDDPRQAMEADRCRHPGTQAVERLSAGLRRRPDAVQHRVGAVARRARGPQVASRLARQPGVAQHAQAVGSATPAARPEGAEDADRVN